jgi:hypothetical protein
MNGCSRSTVVTAPTAGGLRLSCVPSSGRRLTYAELTGQRRDLWSLSSSSLFGIWMSLAARSAN